MHSPLLSSNGRERAVRCLGWGPLFGPSKWTTLKAPLSCICPQKFGPVRLNWTVGSSDTHPNALYTVKILCPRWR